MVHPSKLVCIVTTALLTGGLVTACAANPHDPIPHAGTDLSRVSHSITITFVRHAESAGNVSGLIDTSTPGPDLTAKGETEAERAAQTYVGQGIDGIFASTMVRTQQTAEYMEQALHEKVRILSGLREIEAGQYENQSVATAQKNYFRAPMAWVHGQRSERIPGSIDGSEFDRRFDEAIQQIYDTGDIHPIAVAHGGSIMIWTLMNVKNPDENLLKTHPLGNTAYVQVTGNPQVGWELVDWDGVRVPR